MANSRETAHIALRELWEVADERLRADDAEVLELKQGTLRRLETEAGAQISLYAGVLTVGAEFEKPDGTEEYVQVAFPDDIRSLSDSEVSIVWNKGARNGTNTPSLRQFPQIASDLKALL